MRKRVPAVVKTAKTLLDASEAVDLRQYLIHVTTDVVIHPPPFVNGPEPVIGYEGVREAFDADESKVLVTLELTITDESTSHSFGSEAAMLDTFEGDQVSKIESWLTHDEGLAHVQDPVEVKI